jgi:endonuclease-3
MPKKELKKTDPLNIEAITAGLAEFYPLARTSLNYENPFQLLVATILSAQTTDEQVNKITEKLFREIPTAAEMADLEPADLEQYLKSCGLYRHKSRYLVQTAKILVEHYGGRVPEEFSELVKLPGVGRKTANVVISSAFNKPALAVDTHVFRVSRRIGLADGKNTEVVEEQLKKVIPAAEWKDVHHRLIAHGRQVCHAKNPQCESCFLINLCQFARERKSINDSNKAEA